MIDGWLYVLFAAAIAAAVIFGLCTGIWDPACGLAIGFAILALLDLADS